MAKSAEAFRTISEVSEILETPTHVLRFWETRFVQIRPVKRGGGRRYYRPADVALLGGIKHLLYNTGLSIRDVQRLLKENGVSHVMSYADTSRVFADPAHTSPPEEPEVFDGFRVARRLSALGNLSLTASDRIRLAATRARLLALRQQLQAPPNEHL